MKIAVLGAGPAGSTFAKTVKELHPSWEVDIYELRKEPKSVCAGALGFHAIEKIIKAVGREVLIKTMETEIFEVRIRLEGKVNKEAVITSYNQNIRAGIVVDRKKFDRELLKLAIDAGANYYPSSYAVPKSSREILVRQYEGTVKSRKYDLVVDARGSEAWSHYSKIHVLEQVFAKSKDFDPTTLIIVFNFDVIKTGYLWIIPGSNYEKIGYGEEQKYFNLCPNMYREYMNKYLDRKEIIHKEGATLPLAGKVKLTDNGVFKIGTAAGLVNPFTGAGIYYAIESAYNLATSISDNKYFTYLKYRAKEIIHINEIRIGKYLQKKLCNYEKMSKALDVINGVQLKTKNLYRQFIKYFAKMFL